MSDRPDLLVVCEEVLHVSHAKSGENVGNLKSD